jgi:hypothetical protein
MYTLMSGDDGRRAALWSGINIVAFKGVPMRFKIQILLDTNNFLGLARRQS